MIAPQARPQPLAAEIAAVIDELLDKPEPAAELLREDPLGLRKLGGDQRVKARELPPRFLGLQEPW